MQVRIIYVNNEIQVKFNYDLKLVKIMKSFQARYFQRGKYWSMPKYKVDDLKEELIFNGYKVVEIGNDPYKVIKSATTN